MGPPVSRCRRGRKRGAGRGAGKSQGIVDFAGLTIHNSSSWKITENKKAGEWREPPTFISKGDSGRDTGHLSEIEDFFQALREKRSTRSEIEEGYRTLVLYEAIAESAATGRIVKPAFQTT